MADGGQSGEPFPVGMSISSLSSSLFRFTNSVLVSSLRVSNPFAKAIGCVRRCPGRLGRASTCLGTGRAVPTDDEDECRGRRR